MLCGQWTSTIVTSIVYGLPLRVPRGPSTYFTATTLDYQYLTYYLHVYDGRIGLYSTSKAVRFDSRSSDEINPWVLLRRRAAVPIRMWKQTPGRRASPRRPREPSPRPAKLRQLVTLSTRPVLRRRAGPNPPRRTVPTRRRRTVAPCARRKLDWPVSSWNKCGDLTVDITHWVPTQKHLESLVQPNFSKFKGKTANSDFWTYKMKNHELYSFLRLCVKSRLTHQLLGR